MKEKVCSFTGHRPQNLPFGFNESDERCDKLKEMLRKEIETMITDNNVTHFVSGMAIGVDTYAAEIVLEMKQRYPNIILECALPCETQAVKWTEPARDRYFGIIERCDIETMLQHNYTPDCMEKRNRYMVDKSDYIIAVWDGTPSGTGNTVKYAENKGKRIVIVNPAKISL